MTTNNKKVWFITGASKGLGLSLVIKLLGNGYRVAATSRNVEQLAKVVNSDSTDFFPIQVDLSSAESIDEGIKSTVQKFGQIDVIVNNAGYGIGGAIEELSQQEIHDSFDVNVFATINVIKSAMPFLRQQRSGHIINISSIAGFAAATGWSMYAATKFAIFGLTEVLAEDVKEFGIKATVVAPGAFRTDFLTANSLTIASNTISEYTAIRAIHDKYLQMDGLQAGDPDKATNAFIDLAKMENPPVRLFLGTDAYNRAKQKLQLINEGLENLKNISLSTDFTN